MGTDPWKAFAKSETSWDASLFSSSLPVLPHEKLKLNYRENGSASIDDLSCGNLSHENDNLALSGFLPDDENELLSGVMEDFDLSGLLGSLENFDDDDIFNSTGGMELEPDQQESLSEEISKLSMADSTAAVRNDVPQYAFSKGTGTISGEHPYGEHPSRTLFVRNINSNVEDSELKSLFEQYGAIRTMYTACKHRGFVMISYYDIRDARNAMRALQNKPLRRRKLDIHFSIPKDNPSEKDINQGTLVIFNLDPSVSNEELLKIFGTCGEVKEIRETPQKRHHKFIEFYDVRAAEVALQSLNGCEIAGKLIKLEPSRPGGARKTLMFQLNPELEQDDYRTFLHQMSSPIANSPPGSWMQFGSPIERRPLQNLGQIPGFKSNSSPTDNSYLPGLASILPSQVSNSLKIAPIGQKQVYGFQHAHSLPTQKLNEFHGSVSSVGLSTSNGSVETLSGPQFLWGNPTNPYMDSPGSSKSHNMSLSGQFISFLGNSRSTSQSHHVGSAPPGYPLQRHFDHFSESPKASFMGAAAFGGSSVNMNPRATQGNLFENNNVTNFPILSPPRLSPGFFGGGLYASFSPTGVEGLNDRIRARQSARHEVESRKLFHIDLDKILSGEDNRTTLMIKNIPNKYTSKMLLASIDENHRGTYDFLYLPIDFKNKCNVGYAFINMLSPKHIIAFYEEFNGKRWEKFNSEKVASLAYARIQGKAALISHFQNSSLMNEDKRCRPILLYSDGSGPINQDIFIPRLDIQTNQMLGSESTDF